MAARHVVVDGSNLATEGRSMPSLAQLDRAVREFLMENPDDIVIVVVDASFGHRIDASESKTFQEAEDAGELVSPPAGAIGRGDAFLLRIADKTGATVLSNDSFQEFHGDYEWLFERGRLIGGKPVPGVGWIFTPRTPVRGPRSREAVKEAKRKTKPEAESAMPGLDLAAERSRTKGKGKKNLERAIAVALEEAVTPNDTPRRRRKGGSPPADPVNDPLTFITFIAAHPLGGEVTATVDSFASHGAFVECEGARCYVPLSAMGEPPPKSAREMFSKGEQVRFVVQALDPQRRGVELAVPGFAKIAGAPTEETVAAEIGSEEEPEEGAETAPAPVKKSRSRRSPGAPPAVPVSDTAPPEASPAPPAAPEGPPGAPEEPAPPRPARKAPARRAKKAPGAEVPRGAQLPGAPEEAAPDGPGDTGPDADAVPEPAKKAAKAGRARSAKARPAAPVDAGEGAVPDGAASEAPPTPPPPTEPAAPRRRATRSAPVSTADTDRGGVSEPAPPEPPAPRPRRRSAPRGDVARPVSGADLAAAAPSGGRRRATKTAAVVPPPAPEAVPATPPAPPGRRTRAKKSPSP